MIYFIKGLFTFFKLKVTFVMKSGANVVMFCDEITINKNGNDLTGYETKGKKGGDAFYVRLDDISAIHYRKTWFGKF